MDQYLFESKWALSRQMDPDPYSAGSTRVLVLASSSYTSLRVESLDPDPCLEKGLDPGVRSAQKIGNALVINGQCSILNGRWRMIHPTTSKKWFLLLYGGKPANVLSTVKVKENQLKGRVSDGDPHWFGSPESGSVLGMRIGIQEQGNWPKFTNKLDFQPFKWYVYDIGTY